MPNRAKCIFDLDVKGLLSRVISYLKSSAIQPMGNPRSILWKVFKENADSMSDGNNLSGRLSSSSKFSFKIIIQEFSNRV